ncbi:MAG: ribonuclease III [Acidobacteriota bacterium]|nr:ribonuclease III [Acidobacteriota bacterium]
MKTRRKSTATASSADPANSARRQPLAALQTVLRHAFARPELLRWALTHRSKAYEQAGEGVADAKADNEQLEFIGDAVVGLLVAESLFRRFPQSREGELTRLRASLVSRKHLGEVAAQLELGRYMELGRGEEQSGGRQKPALLANAMEAVIAALYLDGGLEVARSFVEQHIVEPALPRLQEALRSTGVLRGAIGDHKSALQEWLQAIGAGQPEYVLTAQTGPDHDKRFRVEVRIQDADGNIKSLGESEGSTKKKAQQEAARLAMDLLLAEQQAHAEATHE